MTAEERAAEFSWKQCPGGEGHDAGEDGWAYACAKCNANAIREAEDEALERAAREIEVARGWYTIESLAERIRSLKTRGGK